MRITTWNVNGIKTLLHYHPWNTTKTYEALLDALEADIMCIQESKITRAQMDAGLACMKTYDAFFSFYRRLPLRGIHGTAIFTKRPACVPIKAEEGLGSSLISASTTASDRIGGYPLSSDVDLEFSEMKELDSEGRTTICDFGMFVLINLYCPNETNDERLVFKNNFNLMVDSRVRNLIKAGREVIVLGDLNICASDLDACDAEERAKDTGLEHFTDHPPRKWLKEFVGPRGPMIDITRHLHPTRRSMYTCWNIKIDARPTNYGTRLDYILITPGLMPWVKDSNIQPSIMGSDHCPVFLDLHDEIEVEGKGKVKLWDLMNAGRVGRDVIPEPPAFATCNYNEFSGKQKLLSSFFGRKVATPLGTTSPAANATGVKQVNGSTSSSLKSTKVTMAPTTLQSEIPTPKSPLDPSPGAQSGSSTMGRGERLTGRYTATSPTSVLSTSDATSNRRGSKDRTKETNTEVEGSRGLFSQQSSTKSATPPTVAAIKKKKKKGDKSGTDACVPVERRSSSSRDASPEDIIIVDPPPESAHQFPSSATRTPTATAPPTFEFDPADYEASVLNAAGATSKWNNIFTPKAVPKCDGHGEPAKLWTVNKPGINKGRRFYLCSRPVGPGYDKGQAKLHVNPEFRCNFFQWETSVKRPAGVSLLTPGEKRKKAA